MRTAVAVGRVGVGEGGGGAVGVGKLWSGSQISARRSMYTPPPVGPPVGAAAVKNSVHSPPRRSYTTAGFRTSTRLRRSRWRVGYAHPPASPVAPKTGTRNAAPSGRGTSSHTTRPASVPAFSLISASNWSSSRFAAPAARRSRRSAAAAVAPEGGASSQPWPGAPSGAGKARSDRRPLIAWHGDGRQWVTAGQSPASGQASASKSSST
ncbi:MAG: hypothetical protein ABI780_07745 [Ardenticatenales bacterium]